MKDAQPGPVILGALGSRLCVALSASPFRRAPKNAPVSWSQRSADQHHYRQSGVQGTGADRLRPAAKRLATEEKVLEDRHDRDDCQVLEDPCDATPATLPRPNTNPPVAFTRTTR
jgi:hypothetical protein